MTSQEWPIATIFPSDVRSAASAVSSDPSASILRKGVKTTPHGVKVGSSTDSTGTNPWATTPQGIYVRVADVDAHYAHAKAAGANIVRELADTPYGSREYSVRDLEGHLWSFGTYDPWK